MRFPLALWSPVEVRCQMLASRDDVFDLVSEPLTYPKWLVGAQTIRHIDPSFPKPGAEFHHSVGPGEALTVDDSTRSVALDQGRLLVLAVSAGPFHGEVEFRLHERSAGSTEIVIRERLVGRWRPLMPAVRPILALRNRESLRRLSRLLAPAR